MKQILIIGKENACRSQMAEGWMRYYTKGYAEVVSAGIESTNLDLFAANAMSQAILDISKNTSKLLSSVIDKEYDFVLFIFKPDNLEEFRFKGSPKIVVQQFEMPVYGKDKAETENNYGIIRDEIENYCFDFVHLYIRKMY